MQGAAARGADGQRGCTPSPGGAQEFPAERPGLNYDLNWSMNDDGVTPSGDAYRNADLRLLRMHAEGRVEKAAQVLAAPTRAPAARALCTDAGDGFAAVDVDSYEAMVEEVRGTAPRRKRRRAAGA